MATYVWLLTMHIHDASIHHHLVDETEVVGDTGHTTISLITLSYLLKEIVCRVQSLSP